MKIAVVIPAYNAADSIVETLTTVAEQSVQPDEVVVVDDGSSDQTVELVERFAQQYPRLAVRMLQENHCGPGHARNAGVHAASSEWIAFLDADDLWEPHKLQTVNEWQRRNPEGNIFCSNETIRYLDGTTHVTHNAAGFRHQLPIPQQLYRQNLFSTSSVVCRRDLIVRWGGFDPALSSSQDYELWLRMSPDLRPIFISETLGTYVARKDSISTKRFLRRLINKYRVLVRHRRKDSTAMFVYLLGKVTLYHFYQETRPGFKRTVRRLIGR